MTYPEVENTLHDSDVTTAFNELALACGHDVLGRVTELTITEEDFEADPILLQLTSTNVKSSYRNKIVVVRPAIVHSKIVESVLQRTHTDVYDNPKGKSALLALFEEYVSIESGDSEIQAELQRNLSKMIKDPPLPDLLRGIEAFAEAEKHHWAGIYEATLIRPARLMAAWMIAHERNEPLE